MTCSAEFWLGWNQIPECSIILNLKAHQSWPKSAQNGAQFFFSQKSHIFGKRCTIFNPKRLVFCIFTLKFFLKCQNVAIFSSFTGFFWVFSKIFFKKVYSFCFIKAHKKNSRSHLTLKVAPMCYKAHVIEHSENQVQSRVSHTNFFQSCFRPRQEHSVKFCF